MQLDNGLERERERDDYCAYAGAYFPTSGRLVSMLLSSHSSVSSSSSPISSGCDQEKMNHTTLE